MVACGEALPGYGVVLQFEDAHHAFVCVHVRDIDVAVAVVDSETLHVPVVAHLRNGDGYLRIGRVLAEEEGPDQQVRGVVGVLGRVEEHLCVLVDCAPVAFPELVGRAQLKLVA